MVMTIVVIVALNISAAILRYKLTIDGHSQLVQITDIVWGLTFWLVLWQLSSSGYENQRRLGRWVQPSGLFKAFLVWSLSSAVSAWAIWTYANATILRPMREMGDICEVMIFFDEDYKVPPGIPGPITKEIYDELKGLPDAKINVQHIDYITKWHVKTVTDRWGNPYWFRVDPPDPQYPEFDHFTIISCGPSGVFKNGKGDNLYWSDNGKSKLW
jgi:hypothetical protein